MESVLELSKKVFTQTKKHKDYLHRNPELSFCEHNTARYICTELDMLNIPYTIINKTTVIGIIEHNDPNHLNCVALRADIDALPIIENEQNENRSLNGAMHACGHDVHTATLLSVAKILSEQIVNHSATIVLIFQQGEEVLPGGAEGILDNGILDKYKPKIIIGQHVEYSMNVGEFGVCEGDYMASGDEIHIEIRGVGGHAANADITCNPIIAASKIVLLFKEIEKNAPKSVPTVISLGRFIAEGATNIIPNTANIQGTFRTMNEKWRAEAKDQMQVAVNEVESEYGVSVNLNIIKGYPTLYNDIELAKSAKEQLRKVGKVHDLGIRMTTEDFGTYSKNFNTIFYRVGVKKTDSSELFPPHTSTFQADSGSMLYSVAGMLKLALNFIDEIN